jgi:hemoglobin
MMAMTDPVASNLYDELGGEVGVRSLVDRFYDAMDKLPIAQPIRAMHATNLDGSRDKLFWFLSGWLGGPPLFVEKRGHPRLRARHLPFAIDDAARDQWMFCMRQAMVTATLSDNSRARLDAALFQLADHMKNQTRPGLKLVE